jgi:hypothetical protein
MRYFIRSVPEYLHLTLILSLQARSIIFPLFIIIP